MIEFFCGALAGLIVGVAVTCMCVVAHESRERRKTLFECTNDYMTWKSTITERSAGARGGKE